MGKQQQQHHRPPRARWAAAALALATLALVLRSTAAMEFEMQGMSKCEWQAVAIGRAQEAC